MTNPDNAGGWLPNELGFEQWYVTTAFDYPLGSRDCSVARKAWHAALEAARAAELCRAAPAGGDDLYRQACESVEEWKTRALEAEADIARIHAQINAENGPTFMGEPVVSAPAGSGEVETLLNKWLVRYNELIQMDRTYEAEQVLRCINDGKAALLRKLQQGADYVMVPREVVDSIAHCVEKDIRPYFETVVKWHVLIASQDQEGGNGND